MNEPTVPMEDVTQPIRTQPTRIFLEVTAIWNGVDAHTPIREFPQPLLSVRDAYEAGTELVLGNNVYAITLRGKFGVLKPITGLPSAAYTAY